MMKKLLIYLVTVLITATLYAQAPQKMSYQAVIRNASDQLVTNHSVGMKISILQGSAAGTSVYVETQTHITNANGLVTIEIGSGTITTGTFAGIDWATGPYFIKTETDPAGGTSYTIAGTNELLSVPYALYSANGGLAPGSVAGNSPYWNGSTWVTNNHNIFNNGGNIGIGTETPTSKLDVMGEINVNSNKIINIANPVNPQDAATKAYVDNALKELGLIPNNYSGLVFDIEGNTYKIVTIGTQTWMAENLRAVHFKDGTAIELVIKDWSVVISAWSNLTTPGYCWYNNDEATNKATYGALYNFYTVSTGNLCPTGWHVPTDAEWTTLTTYLGGESTAGGKLRQTGTAHWVSPNMGATNETGFTALPGGGRNDTGLYDYIGNSCIWWSSTENTATGAWLLGVGTVDSSVTRASNSKQNGFSVRCLKNN